MKKRRQEKSRSRSRGRKKISTRRPEKSRSRSSSLERTDPDLTNNHQAGGADTSRRISRSRTLVKARRRKKSRSRSRKSSKRKKSPPKEDDVDDLSELMQKTKIHSRRKVPTSPQEHCLNQLQVHFPLTYNKVTDRRRGKISPLLLKAEVNRLLAGNPGMAKTLGRKTSHESDVLKNCSLLMSLLKFGAK